MRRLLILLSAIPILATFGAAQFLGLRVLAKAGQLSLSLDEILEKLKDKGTAYSYKSFIWAGAPLSKKGEAFITEKQRSSHSSLTIAQELTKIGLSEIWKTHASLVKWRIKMVKMGYFLPPFAGIGVIFATAVGRLPAMWAIAIFALVLATCCVMLWLSRTVSKEAARAVISILERKRVLPRLREEEELIEAIKAWSWVSLMPGIALTVMLKPTKKQEED